MSSHLEKMFTESWISELSSNLLFWRWSYSWRSLYGTVCCFGVFLCVLGCEQSRVYSVMGGNKVPATCQRHSELLCPPDCHPGILQIKQRMTLIGRLSCWRWGWPSRKKGMLWWFLLLAVGSLELQQSGRNTHSQRRDVKMMHSPFLDLDYGHFFFFSLQSGLCTLREQSC